MRNLYCIIFFIGCLCVERIIANDSKDLEDQSSKRVSSRGLFSGQKWNPWNKLANSKSDSSLLKDESSKSDIDDFTRAGNSSGAREGKCNYSF